jgi:hypothetical protein
MPNTIPVAETASTIQFSISGTMAPSNGTANYKPPDCLLDD